MYNSKEEYTRHIVEELITKVEKYNDSKNIISVALSGSFGRDEATFTQDNNGNYILQSDVEVDIIYTKKRRSVERLLARMNSEMDEFFSLMPISERRVRKVCNFNYTLIPQKYKTLFTYDLYNGSKTIWGKRIIEGIHLSIDKCDIYEAKRLVANRIGEMLYIRHSSKKNDINDMQWKCKLILAIASAWLICNGDYSSSYRGQNDKIISFAEKVTECLGQSFIEDYQNAFVFLRSNGRPYDPSENKLREYVRRIEALFLELDIHKPKVNSFSRLLKYFDKYRKTEMRFGILNFEDNILQSLIDYYINSDPKLLSTSSVWYIVLH